MMRKWLTLFEALHLMPNVDRLYANSKTVERGMMSMKELVDRSKDSLTAI